MFAISKQYINCRCGLHLQEYQKQDPKDPERLGIIDGNGKFTACHKHGHITRGKYEEVLPQIIDEFLDVGCIETIKFFQKKIDIKKKYKKLQEDESNIDEITAKKNGYLNEIIRCYMPHIYEVGDHKGNNLINLWTKENIEHAFKLLDKPNYTVNSSFLEFLKRVKFTSVTIYSPIMTKSLIKELNCKTIFDPCIGWGGRMIGTTCLGNDYHYTGCEPFTKTFYGLEKIVKDLQLESQVELYNHPVENILESLNHKRYDMCLTSPPYFDLEIYSHEDTQSIKNYKTYDEWIESFIRPIIDFVCAHVDKYSCWSVKNVQTDKKYNLLDDVIRLHQENGWKLVRNYSIKKVTSNDKNADGDVTYVFSKE